VRELTIVEQDNGELVLTPRNCVSQTEVIGLIEAARIRARCAFICTACLVVTPEQEVPSAEPEPEG
jgi:hypothetical protein